MRDIQSDVHETRFMSRGLKQAFRQATRSNNPMAVVAVLDKAKEMNVPLKTGVRMAGDLERGVGRRYYEKKAAWEKTRAAEQAAPMRRKAEDMVAAFGAGEMTKEELLSQGKAIGGNAQSIMGLAYRMGFKDRFSQPDQPSTGLPQPATQAPAVQPAQAAPKPASNMPNYGGKWEDSIHNPANYSGPNAGSNLRISGPAGDIIQSGSPTSRAPMTPSGPSPLSQAFGEVKSPMMILAERIAGKTTADPIGDISRSLGMSDLLAPNSNASNITSLMDANKRNAIRRENDENAYNEWRASEQNALDVRKAASEKRSKLGDMVMAAKTVQASDFAWGSDLTDKQKSDRHMYGGKFESRKWSADDLSRLEKASGVLDRMYNDKDGGGHLEDALMESLNALMESNPRIAKELDLLRKNKKKRN